jgi:hypothetical protein
VNADAGIFLGPNNAGNGVALFKHNPPLWTFQLVAAGVYRIKPATLDCYLSCREADGSPPENLTKVVLSPTDDKSGREQWTLTAAGDGSFNMTIEKLNPDALKHPGYRFVSCPPAGTVVDLWNGGDGDRQRWLISVPAQG